MFLFLFLLQHIVEAFVVAVLGDEFIVQTAFHDFAFIEDTDDVGMLDNGEYASFAPSFCSPLICVVFTSSQSSVKNVEFANKLQEILSTL